MKDILKKNKNNHPCCYKKTKKDIINNKSSISTKKLQIPKNSCPKIRLPDINGKCKDDFINKKNKYGVECCFKKTKKNI